jgi:hypothetical protein
VEIIEEQTGMREGEFAAPDLIGSCGDFLVEGDLLQGGGAVIALENADDLPGLDRDGDMDIQRTGLVGYQCAEGFFMQRGFAVIEDSHGRLLGNVFIGACQ